MQQDAAFLGGYYVRCNKFYINLTIWIKTMSRTGGLEDGRTSGLANARTRTNGRNNCSTRQETTATTAWTMGQVLEWTMEAAARRTQQQRLGPLDLLGDLRLDKNKKCRQGGCMQHLVFAWPSQAWARTKRTRWVEEPVQFGEKRCKMQPCATCCASLLASLLKWRLLRLLAAAKRRIPRATRNGSIKRQIKFW